MRRLALALLAALLVPGGGVAEVGSGGHGVVEVVVLGGLASLPDPAPPRAAEPALHLVVDFTSSMRASDADGGPTPKDAALAASIELLEALPESARPTLHALGVAAGSECPPSVRAAFDDPDEALGYLRASRSRAEGSFPDALARAAETLAPGDRVVALSDLETSCGGDLCAAVRAIDEAGSVLDLIALSDAPLPACLAGPRGAATPEPVAEPVARQPRFVVREWPPGNPGREAVAVAGRSSVRVPGGTRVAVIVELPEPIQLGPLDVVPGETLRIEVLEFPILGVREAYVGGERHAARGRIEGGP